MYIIRKLAIPSLRSLHPQLVVIFFSEIFGIAECEITHSVNCEISRSVRCEMKFAHIRVSAYFTYAKQIFHSEAISLARRANFVKKSTHCPYRQMCAFSFGGTGGVLELVAIVFCFSALTFRAFWSILVMKRRESLSVTPVVSRCVSDAI